MIQIVTGDLIEMAKQGHFDVIVHGCNCWNTMGRGIARQIRNSFPEAYQKDQETIKGDINKLGNFTAAQCKDLIVVNAYTQYYYGYMPNVNYPAIRQSLGQIFKAFRGKRIGMPFIGAGLAGGEWGKIRQIIDDLVTKEDLITIVQYAHD